MTEQDQDLLRQLGRDHRRMEHLARRIARSIGENPRRLPSRTVLAIERTSRRMSVIATAVLIGMLIASAIDDAGMPTEEPSLLAGVLEGKLARAQDVYVALNGLAIAGTGP